MSTKNRFPNYPKYVGQPSIPLSPHNSEISERDARDDLDFLGLDQPKGRSRKKLKIDYVPKGANRADRTWEARVWHYLNSPNKILRWSRKIERLSGRRVFECEEFRVRVICEDDNTENLRWSDESEGWREIRLSEAQSDTKALSLLGGVIKDLCERFRA